MLSKKSKAVSRECCNRSKPAVNSWNLKIPSQFHIVIDNMQKWLMSSMVSLKLVILSRCRREFGPAMEYGGRCVSPPGHCKILRNGSEARRAWRTLSLVMWYPCDLRLPVTSDSPTHGFLRCSSFTNVYHLVLKLDLLAFQTQLSSCVPKI